MSTNGISRRDFLKGTVAGAAGLAAMSLFPGGAEKAYAEGMSAESQESLNTVEQLDRKWSFEIAPDPITDDQISEVIETEVVVLGGGMSGLCTACSATEMGVDVIVVSAAAMPIARGGSNHGINSKRQQELGIKYTKEDAAKLLKRQLYLYGYKVDTEKWNKWLNNSEESTNWLIDKMASQGLICDMEAGIEDVDGIRNSPPTSHTFSFGDGMGAMGGANLQAEAYAALILEQGGQIHYNTRGVQLIRGGVPNGKEGRVEGLIAVNPEGKYVKYLASRGVVLATGDFSKDEEMVAKYCPGDYEYFKDQLKFTSQFAEGESVNYSASMARDGLFPGDGHKMGLWVGAAWQKNHPTCVMSAGVVDQPMNTPVIFLERDGKRFCEENLSISYFTYLFRYHRQFYTCFSADLFTSKDEWFGMGALAGQKGINSQQFRENMEAKVVTGGLKKGETLRDLFEQFDNIDVDQAIETVERWNGFCEKGEDEDFHINKAFLIPIKNGPFYGSECNYESGRFFESTLGGLRTNIDMQVCEEDDTPILGLYCVGSMIGDLYSNMYTAEMTGINLGAACGTFAYMLGRDLAKPENPKYPIPSTAKPAPPTVVDPMGPKVELVHDLEGVAEAGKWADGTYTTKASGINGPFDVTVEIKDGFISDIQIGANSETPDLGGVAIKDLPGLILEKQSWNVDSVSGASFTSAGIKMAVQECLRQASIG